MAMPIGAVAARIGVPTVFVAMSIGVTLFVSESNMATYAVLPSGVMAIPIGPFPTIIEVPAVLVAMSIGVTLLPSKSVTYAVVPSGVMAINCGLLGMRI